MRYPSFAISVFPISLPFSIKKNPYLPPLLLKLLSNFVVEQFIRCSKAESVYKLTIKQSGPCRHIDSPFGPSFENCKQKEQNQTLILRNPWIKNFIKTSGFNNISACVPSVPLCLREKRVRTGSDRSDGTRPSGGAGDRNTRPARHNALFILSAR